MIARLLILIALAAVPPWTPDQQAQLALDDPADQLEGPALVPLLENVLTWDASSTASSDLPAPDYATLLADPLAHRGDPVLIQGSFAGRARRFNLNQTGPWGEALTEWVLIVRDDPEQVAVVYLIDPDQQLQTPRSGTAITVPARFYKVWTDTDQHGQPTDYLAFIAHHSAAVGGQPAARLGSALPMLLGILVLSLLYLFIWRITRPKHARFQPTPDTPNPPDHAMLSGQARPDLPDDPAKALQRLADQHKPH